MKFEITQMLPIYDSEGKVIKTNITFKPNDKSIMVVDINKDLTNETEDVVNSVLLDEIYNNWFPNKAENEKFREVNEALNKANETINLNRKAFGDMIVDFTRLEDMIYQLSDHVKYSFDEIESEETNDETE